MNTSEIRGLFENVLPSESIVSDQAELRVYECDGLSAYRQIPKLVVLPDCIEQVQRTMAICREHSLPIVSRGVEPVCRGAPCLTGRVLF